MDQISGAEQTDGADLLSTIEESQFGFRSNLQGPYGPRRGEPACFNSKTVGTLNKNNAQIVRKNHNN